MNIQDALQIFGLSGEVGKEQAKLTYRNLCSKYHPDRNPAGLQMMQAINSAWDTLQNAYAQGWNVTAQDSNNASYGDELNDAITAIVSLDGLEIEVCGSWVWVGGDTRTHKTAIRAAGYKWAPKKKMWYFRPANYKSKSRGKCTIDDIREIHGSTHVASKTRQKLSYA